MSSAPSARKKSSPRASQGTLDGAGQSTVFTLGYSGHTPESFLTVLTSAGVLQVLDVRSFPRSRKPGFSKGALSSYLTRSGLTYVHLPQLGAPRALLAEKKGGRPFEAIARAYESHLANQGRPIDEAVRLARQKPSVLICLEKDARECHRGLLAKRFTSKGFRVVHL